MQAFFIVVTLNQVGVNRLYTTNPQQILPLLALQFTM